MALAPGAPIAVTFEEAGSASPVWVRVSGRTWWARSRRTRRAAHIGSKRPQSDPVGACAGLRGARAPGAGHRRIVKTCPIQPPTSNVPERTKPWHSYHATSGGAPAQQSTRSTAAAGVARLLDRRSHEQGADAAAGVPARGHERLDVALGLVDRLHVRRARAQDERAERRRVGVLRDAEARAVRPRLDVPDRAGALADGHIGSRS